MSSRPGVVFQQSLARCLEDDQFLASFYERFLGASEEIRLKFADTDFPAQHRMLERSLRLSAAAAEGDRAALQEINERAVSHDHEHLDIRPELYELWLDAIIVTAAPKKLPTELLNQLKVGGRLVIPVGDVFQELQVIVKRRDKYDEEVITPVRFVPMVREEDARLSNER